MGRNIDRSGALTAPNRDAEELRYEFKGGLAPELSVETQSRVWEDGYTISTNRVRMHARDWSPY